MTDTVVNAGQIEFWNGPAGAKWADFHAALDTMMDPLGLQAIQQADPRSGEDVLDVGCGCGSTSIQLSRRGATVTGIDISNPMLDVARSRAAATGDDIRFLQADAAAHTFAGNSFDLIFSRFGVMFFEDPVRAFSNLRSALTERGRLCFLCWRPVTDNPWMMIPLTQVLRFIAPPEPAPAGSPGPFAFADSDYVQSILSASGFRAIDFKAIDSTISVGGGGELEESLTFLEKVGPVASLIAEQSAPIIENIRAALLDELKDYQTADGIRMGAACWIVTAENSVG
jgi:SAM-dependent methyltransferase